MSDRKKKILIGTSIVLMVLVIGLILLKNFISTDLTRIHSWTSIETDNWNRIELSNNAIAADGSEYYGLVKKGNSKNLIIYFDGGGIAWDALSANDPMLSPKNLINGYVLKKEHYGCYTEKVIPFVLNESRITQGFLDFNNPVNPFNDWNILYIPYATGDFHIGNATIEYPIGDEKVKTIYHNGRNNVTELLEFCYKNFESPEKVVVSGSSAGSYGSSFWVGPISKHYYKSQIYHVADSLYLNSEKIKNTLETYWNANLIENFGYEASNEMTTQIYHFYANNHYPNLKFLQSHTTDDGTVIHFSKMLDDSMEGNSDVEGEWKSKLKGSIKAIESLDIDYDYYITDYRKDAKTGLTPHMMLAVSYFYDIEEDNIKYVDWLKRKIILDESISVGVDLLD